MTDEKENLHSCGTAHTVLPMPALGTRSPICDLVVFYFETLALNAKQWRRPSLHEGEKVANGHTTADWVRVQKFTESSTMYGHASLVTGHGDK